MTAAKIAITLPQAQVAHIRRVVREGRAESVSGYIAEALSAQARQESLRDLVAAMVEQHGEPTQKEVTWSKRTIRQRRRA